MTSTPTDRLAVIGTGLIGTSVALAAGRVGCAVSGWDLDEETAMRSAARGGFTASTALAESRVQTAQHQLAVSGA